MERGGCYIIRLPKGGFKETGDGLTGRLGWFFIAKTQMILRTFARIERN